MTRSSADAIRTLCDSGVEIIDPAQTWIDTAVSLDSIEAGTVLFPGTRLEGESLTIGPGCRIGEEGPATVRNCALGEGVQLNGGFFDGAVFLDGSEVGSASHIRPGTLMEEQSSCAHGVGLKQTIFLPFMVAGSLINFCDALMAGGTHRSNHSEIGSGYIHFNFTPRGDKATPSLVGDVPRGVLMNQDPIFLGGQGGLVGPVSVAYGTVMGAGIIQRRDVDVPGRLITGEEGRSGSVPFNTEVYGKVDRVLHHNLAYIGNIQALQVWYTHVRCQWMTLPWQQRLHASALKALDRIYRERCKRLKDLTQRIEKSVSHLEAKGAEGPALTQQKNWLLRCEDVQAFLQAWSPEGSGPPSWVASVLEALNVPERPYLETVQGASETVQNQIRDGLQGVVDAAVRWIGPQQGETE